MGDDTKRQSNVINLVRHEDVVQPFMLHNSLIRGRMVRMDNTLGSILSRHNYPETVSKLLGEMLVLSSMLSANLPDGGILTLQTKSDGPVSFMVTDAQSDGSVRAYANIIEERVEEMHDSNIDMQSLLGKGYLAMTLDHPQSEPYQGIVPLEGESLSEALTYYFNQSQQLDVMFHIDVSKRVRDDGTARWVSGGIMLERLPEFSQEDAASDALVGDWDYHKLLVKTASAEELSDPHLAPSALLYRLFNEGGVWVYDTQHIQDKCRCSRERISATLESLPAEELETLAIEGQISVICQFCSREELFIL